MAAGAVAAAATGAVAESAVSLPVSTGDAQLTRLDSGIRVVTEDVPSVRSVALGLWVRTGSRNETPAQAGVSHFLEHLLFKGTKRHDAIEIAEIFDGMGASINAATGKESTHLYARFLDTHTEKAFDLLSEMLLEPTYPEIDSERQVVIEEIAMYEDEPSDRVHDVLDAAVFGDHPLGRRVLGTAEVIGSIPVPDISDYHHSRYTADNVVVAAAGNVDHDAIVELATKYVNPTTESKGPAQLEPPNCESRFGFMKKDTEQYHVCLGGPGIARGDDRRFALTLLDTVFGGSTSSRLFREVREKRGLAYAVGSYTQQFVDGGLVGLYVGTREDNVEEACDVIGNRASEPERRGRHRGRAGPCQGERQGPDGPLERVHRGADGPHRQVGPLRYRRPHPRRDDRQGRRRHRRRGRGAGRRVLRTGQALGRRGREGRGPLSQGAGSGQRSARDRLTGPRSGWWGGDERRPTARVSSVDQDHEIRVRKG